MRGFLYRLAITVKDAGERWNIPPLIGLALALKAKLSFAEHCEAFKGVDFGGNPTGGRILWALYRYRIHSIEELARTQAAKLLDCRRIGPKSVERIRSALRSSHIVSEARGIPEAAVTRQEN